MNIGIVGLGKMGSNLIVNLKNNKFNVSGYDVNKNVRNQMKEQGINCVGNLDELLENLGERKVIWMMLPSGDITNSMIKTLTEKLKAKDIIIDAGNSNYKDTIKNAKIAEEKDICFLDVGTSGGTTGARNGACLMVGGNQEAFEYLKEVFELTSIKDGLIYAGKAGSGHFMKMVHNGIEYGMMQAIGEGFQILRQSEFDYDLAEVAKNYNNGSVIRGWLMELMEEQLIKHHNLEDIEGVVDANGEAKWTVETALEMDISVPVIALSLMARSNSKDTEKFAYKAVAALRNGFGGHDIVSKE